ncbi:hypothetical protein H2248_004514 [Termitomyces sp. 'cryptogamus']|nr:hypothetical protein H2248_004514 [Termitomyces sp. 'cryptogamus']
MSSKSKPDVKPPVLKGKEAEDKVLEYMKSMNRPYGAVDVAANLKGAIPKATVQKILVALTEKDFLVQKTYGKTTFFVFNQSNIESVPASEIATIEAQQKTVDEENKAIASELKTIQSELLKLKATPSDQELEAQVCEADNMVSSLSVRLQPLRSGAPLISEAEMAHIDAEWTKWRSEWIKRRKVFMTFWQLATDALPPQEAASLAEDLGVELDTSEHIALERSQLCICARSNPLKRKR